MREFFRERVKRSTIILVLAVIAALSISTVTFAVGLGSKSNLIGTEMDAERTDIVKATFTPKSDEEEANTEKIYEIETKQKETEQKETELKEKELKKAENKESEVAESESEVIEYQQSRGMESISSYDEVNASIDSTENYVEEDVSLAYVEPTNIYKYCPTNINGNVLYCSNEAEPGEVKDGICINGVRVLTTTPGDWDSVQVCDPSVVAGDFSFNGSNYTYLMAYLGCATYDCTANEIGFAVSNDLWNWIKVGRVVSAVRDGAWGVGQPSLMNIDGGSDVLLFYTSGTSSLTTTYVKLLSCGDLNNIVDNGTKRITCSYDFISNADFAYSDGKLYMTCDTHPFNAGALGFISDIQSVYSAFWDRGFDSIDSLAWSYEAQIGVGQTGYVKNHNGCFVRDSYGNLVGRQLMVSTASEVGDYLANLFTYRFMTVSF